MLAGTIHKLRRKIIESLFNNKYLLNYETFFDKCSNYCADLLEKEGTNDCVDIKHYIKRSMVDVVLGNNRSI